MYETDTTDITLGVNPYHMYHASRKHQLKYEALCYKTWSRFKLWLGENCHNHDMGVKPHALYMNKLFVECGDNLTTLWDTVVMSNEYVQEPTKMFGESNTLC